MPLQKEKDLLLKPKHLLSFIKAQLKPNHIFKLGFSVKDFYMVKVDLDFIFDYCYADDLINAGYSIKDLNNITKERFLEIKSNLNYFFKPYSLLSVFIDNDINKINYECLKVLYEVLRGYNIKKLNEIGINHLFLTQCLHPNFLNFYLWNHRRYCCRSFPDFKKITKIKKANES